MSFKSGVKGRGSDRWWEREWWLWWGDMHRMRLLKNAVCKIFQAYYPAKITRNLWQRVVFLANTGYCYSPAVWQIWFVGWYESYPRRHTDWPGGINNITDCAVLCYAGDSRTADISSRAYIQGCVNRILSYSCKRIFETSSTRLRHWWRTL